MRPARLLLSGLLLCSASAWATPPADAPHASRVFSVHDTDGDGYLSREEYETLLQMRRQRQAAAGRPLDASRGPPAFDQVDANQDEMISVDELGAILVRRLRLRRGPHPEAVPAN